jgi:ADP-ribose pyrophosphatase YjhB (NUDIX family)
MNDTTYTVRAFPVSVKGVVVRDSRVLLLKNEREEWELPGGKLELGEEPAACVAREIALHPVVVHPPHGTQRGMTR